MREGCASIRVVPLREIAMFFWWPFLPALDPVDTAAGQRHNAKNKAGSRLSDRGGRPPSKAKPKRNAVKQPSKAKPKRKAVKKSAAPKRAARKPARKARSKRRYPPIRPPAHYH